MDVQKDDENKTSEVENNVSMEELKVEEDENIKETSLEEDILGAQSLLMSASEDEEDDVGNKSPEKKIGTQKKSKRILDSDDEEENQNTEEPRVEKPKGNISAITDPDSETEPQDDDDSHSKLGVVKHKSRISALIDSESEEEQQVSVESENNDLAKYQPSDSKSIKATKKLKKHKKDKKHIAATTDSDSSSENETGKVKKNKISDLVESESESDSNTDNEEQDLEASAQAANFTAEKNKNKPIRASAKKAMDEMQAIQSEQQRLHREAHITIPYHKAKKHTLKEFLNRRTIIKPQLATESRSPVAAAVQSRRLKMTAEELEEYAKLMDERANEAKEFFKSESESEEEVFKDNDGVLDKSSENQQQLKSNNCENVTPTNTADSNENSEISTNILNTEQEEVFDAVQLNENDLAEIFDEQAAIECEEIPSTSKVHITEIIELPKLDMNTIQISPVKKLVPPIKTPRNSINIKQLLSEKNLTESPSLSGDTNMLIDLETGDLIEKKPSGIENLMERLISSVKSKKSRTTEICSILSTENGKLEMTKVNISVKEEKDPNQKEPKPGAAYFELKKNLKDLIKKKRLKELHKKQEEDIEYNKCLADDDDDDCQDDAEEDNMEDNANETEEYADEQESNGKEIMIDDEENALVVEDEDEDDDAEDEAGESDVEEAIADDKNTDEEEEDSDEDDDDDEETNAGENKRKNRIIKAFDDSDEEEDEADKDDLDFLKTQPLPSEQLILDSQTLLKNNSTEDAENDLMSLCSGTFDITQKSPTKRSALMSQIPLTQNAGVAVNDDELMELCSGTFDQPVAESQMSETQNQTEKNTTNAVQARCNKILSSDEEDDNAERMKNNENTMRTKKLTKKLKKKKAKLGFSDDEDDDDDGESLKEAQAVEEEEDEEEDNNLEDEPETFVEYDSEENEIVVQMTKKECRMKAANFVEKEAELSESEWGSADEDEKNLDKYDIEVGDEDEFDKDKLQTELGQIHARKMLDEDIREVRKIQEMLLEDEENDGVGRQRQFKWKNAENGFSLEDGSSRRPENDDGKDGESGDDFDEHEWRKIRYEREQFLKEKGLVPDSQDMSTTLIANSNYLSNSKPDDGDTTIHRKIQIITAKNTFAISSDAEKKKSSPFLISKGVNSTNKKPVRGSFLVRDQETLNKLAGMTKGSAAHNASNMDDAAGTVSISIKPKNFVFATLTEEEHENLKRKAEDLLNSSTETGTNFMKKPKFGPRREKCLIDQLL